MASGPVTDSALLEREQEVATLQRAFAGGAAPARAVFEDASAGNGQPADEGGFAGLHGLYWLTLNLAGVEPLLLAVDDLHWCDQTSQRFVAYLEHRLEGDEGVERLREAAGLLERSPAALERPRGLGRTNREIAQELSPRSCS
ncbi:MAG: hypothetical protein ACRDL4_07425 [Thermoleophilaceae bacterium]